MLGILASCCLALCSCGAPVEQTAAGAINQAASAVESSALALDLLAGERAGTPVVETSLEDMSGELEEARKELQDTLPETAAERELHQRSSKALERAEGALSRARHALAAKDFPGPTQENPDLGAARAALAASSAELGQLREQLGSGR
ncbi:hypothetical protein BIU82_14245 [Arthrobacter sp. SW1]|nr:hypothetical protein BIU82_14245 [Arthrobacter sp. SW1]